MFRHLCVITIETMKSNNSNIDDQTLIRFITGEVTQDERIQVERWLQTDSDNQTHFSKLELLWNKSKSVGVFDQIDADKNWDQVRATLGIGESKKAKQVFMLPRLMRYAAAVLLLAAVTVLVFKLTTDQPTEMLRFTADNQGTPFVLPDGSEVWLNEGSELVYPEKFGESVRRVQLIGEGFFEVEHDPSHPFIVKSGETEAKVLGTSFNLKGANSTALQELVLVTGKVQFSKGDSQIILSPGERVVVNSSGELEKLVNTDLNFMAWKTRALVFENTKMEQVMKDIADLYNISISFEQESFKTCPLTTRFENESLESVLQTIKLLFGVEITQNGNAYTISGGGC